MKPHVICLMASSVDGRHIHSRWRPKGAGADFSSRCMTNSAATPGWSAASPARSSPRASRIRLDE